MKIGYFVKGLGETIEDTHYIDCVDEKDINRVVNEDAHYDIWFSDEEIDRLKGEIVVTFVVDGVEKGDLAICGDSVVLNSAPILMSEGNDTIN